MQEWTAQNWINQGAPASKIAVGLGTYARTFTVSKSNAGFGVPSTGAGAAGTYTREAGFLSYYEVWLILCTCIHI